MIKAIIIEDELRGRNALAKMLDTFDDKLVLLGMAENAETGKQLIADLKPDLVFLDIEMPHKNGFDLLAETQGKKFEVIFTTAYNQYAIKAFKFSAIDYLLKPIDLDELERAIDKAIERMNSHKRNDANLGIDVLLQNIKNLSSNGNKIALPTLDGLVFVPIKDIIRCESDANYTQFFILNEKPLVISKTLKEFEDMLETHDFVRVHHSHLINMLHIKRYIKGEGGIIVMIDNSEVEVSRRKKELFLEKLKVIMER